MIFLNFFKEKLENKIENNLKINFQFQNNYLKLISIELINLMCINKSDNDNYKFLIEKTLTLKTMAQPSCIPLNNKMQFFLMQFKVREN